MTFKSDPPADRKPYEKDLDLFNDPFSSRSVTQMIPEGRESSGHPRGFRLVPEIRVRSIPLSRTRISNLREPLVLFRDLDIAKHRHECYQTFYEKLINKDRPCFCT